MLPNVLIVLPDGGVGGGANGENQDTVEWGSLFVGCAGGGDSLITLPVEQEAVDPASFESFRQAKYVAAEAGRFD